MDLPDEIFKDIRNKDAIMGLIFIAFIIGLIIYEIIGVLQ